MNDLARPSRGEGRILQIILSLAAFAAFTALLFVPRAAYYDESFFGLVLSALKGSFIGNAVSRASLYVLVAAYAAMLVCTAASLFCRTKAALAFNYAKALCMLAAFSFFTGALLYNYGLSLSDVFYDTTTFFSLNATSIALVVSLVFLVALGFTAFGGYGFVKLIGLLLGAAFLLLGLLPFAEGLTLFDVFGLAPMADTPLGTAVSVAFAVYAWATLVNFGLAAISLALPRHNLIDALRSDLFFVIAAAAAALYGAYAGFESLAAYPGMLASAGTALGQLIFINIFAFRGRKKTSACRRGRERAPARRAAAARPRRTHRRTAAGRPAGELCPGKRRLSPAAGTRIFRNGRLYRRAHPRGARRVRTAVRTAFLPRRRPARLRAGR